MNHRKSVHDHKKRIPRYSMGGVLGSVAILYILLNLTIIGVIMLPNLVGAVIRALARAESLSIIEHGSIMVESPGKGILIGRELSSIVIFIGCFVGIWAYHAPLYKYFKLRALRRPVSGRLLAVTRSHLLKSARITATVVFCALTIANIYFFTGLLQKPQINFIAEETTQQASPREDATRIEPGGRRSFSFDSEDIGRTGNIRDSMHIVPLSFMIQLLITLYAYYHQNHRVKSKYFLHVFDTEAVHARPPGMKRSSIRFQIWLTNLLTTLLPLILVLVYFYAFLTTKQLSSYTREELVTLYGQYASLIEPGELGDLVYNTLQTNPDIPFFGKLFYFTPLDTIFMIFGVTIGVIVIVTYSYFLSKWAIQDIITPLRELQRNIQKTADGDLNHLTPVRTNNEIGEVTEHFNEMVRSLKAAEHLESEKSAAEAANRAKSAFLANMSHELRTPLNAILGFGQLMSRDANLTPDQRQNLATINRSGEHLLDLINDVLDISKIESGRISLNPTHFDLYYLLDGISEIFLLRAQKKGISLLFERSADLPQYIYSDENKIRQVLMNLLSNAVKFTSEGGISVRVGKGKSNGSKLRIHFEIEDSGVGIEMNETESIFEPFSQTDSGKQQQEGTGLGLPISRSFIEMMGGSISVQSTPGEGSLFVFEIEVQTGEEAEVRRSRPRRVTGVSRAQSDIRLLIVEDRETNRVLLRNILQPFGFELREAENGEKAIEVWSEWEPQLIFMDMQMPVMNGHEATKRIKATTRGQATVIVALTASAFDDERALILSEGCDDFIRKPFRDSEIFEKLEQHLGIEFIYEDLSEAVEKTQTGTIAIDPGALGDLDIETREQLRNATVAGDLDAILELIEGLRPTNPEIAEGLANLAQEFDYASILELLKGAEHT